MQPGNYSFLLELTIFYSVLNVCNQTIVDRPTKDYYGPSRGQDG